MAAYSPDPQAIVHNDRRRLWCLCKWEHQLDQGLRWTQQAAIAWEHLREDHQAAHYEATNNPDTTVWYQGWRRID